MKLYSALKSVTLLITLLMTVGCVTQTLPDAYIMKPGMPMEKVDPAKINAQAYQYTLSPLDVLLVQVHPLGGSTQHKIDEGNRLRVLFSEDKSNSGLYKIVSGDELSLEFPEDIDTLFQVVVGPDGRIALPRVGKMIKVAGLTLPDLNKITAKEYRDLYVSPKPSWGVTRSFNNELKAMGGEYSVDYNGDVIVPNLGRFNVLGKTSQSVEQVLSYAASTRFNNKINASVSVAKVNVRDQVDKRLSPSGLEMSLNLSNTPTMVSQDGMVYIPRVGNVSVDGKTIAEFKREITPLIQAQYQNPVSVNVSVQEYAENNIFIGGEVNRPGRYPFARKLSIMKLIAVAGWVNQAGDLGNVILLRASGDNEYTVYRTNLAEVIDGKVGGAQDFKITPQDMVIVPPTEIAKANRYVEQYIKGILPFGANVNYNVNSNAVLGN